MSIFVENSLLVPTFLNTPRQSPKGQLKLDIAKINFIEFVMNFTESIDPELICI